MRPLRSLLVYLAVVVLGGALLAPWLYKFAQWGGQWGGWLQRVANHPFHRCLHRSLLVLAMVGAWPLMRSFGIQSWSEVGLVKVAGQGANFGRGILLGLGSLALVVTIEVAGGARRFLPSPELAGYPLYFLQAAGTALVVGCLEEVLFRGILFGALRKTMRWTVALALSSVVYAWVHFFAAVASPTRVTWASGLMLLPEMLRGFLQWDALVPGFLALTWAGVLLALAYERTGNLFFSIGLHAGWIFWLRAYGVLTQPAKVGSGWFWGTNKLIDGWLGLLALGAAGWVLHKWLLPKGLNRHPQGQGGTVSGRTAEVSATLGRGGLG